MANAFFVLSKQKDRSRKRISDDGDNIEDNYEQRLSKRRREEEDDDDDDDMEVRSLLPIKSKEMGVVQRTIKVAKREFAYFI